MTIYADKNFYLDQYLSGKEPTIPIDEIEYWLAQASRKINRRAFGKTDALQEVPDEVKMCCCAVAEKLYQFESAKSENGMVLQSYGNDGETATYKTLQEVPDEVKMCCCAVAEKLYQFESAKSENGMVLQSYGNDGETATYKTTDMSELAISSKVLEIIEEWLMPTGLLYCGVDM